MVSHVDAEYDKPSVKTRIFEEHLTELKELLRELNITNYTIISNIGPNVSHGGMFSYALDQIRDPNYHTLFDEQDTFWLNDLFLQKLSDLLCEYDLIGVRKQCIPYLWSRKHVEKFNARFGINHDMDSIPVIHLPQILSNRVIQKLQTFDGNSNNRVNVEDFADINDVPPDGRRIVDLDTFQLLNIEVCKQTTKIKIYESETWDIGQHFVSNRVTDYNQYTWYHPFASGCLAASSFWSNQITKDVIQNVLIVPMMTTQNWELRNCFYYQSLQYLNFKYKNNYIKNYDLIAEIEQKPFDSHAKDGQTFSMTAYDCSSLLQRVL
jgi:hypothetical protein